MSVVHAVQDNAHSLPSSDEGGDADEESDEGEDTPGPTSAAEGDENSGDEASDDTCDPEPTSEDDAGAIAIADGPANEVGVGLPTQRPLDGGSHLPEGRWVGRILQSMEQGGALLGREIELARTTIGNVDGDDARDLLSVRLNGDCRV